MKLAETKYDNHVTGCCAEVDPAKWDGKVFRWTDQRFVRDRVRAFLHVPLDFAAVVGRVHAAVEQAEAYPDQPFWLSDEVSPWHSDLYLAVDRDVPGADMITLSGTFLTRVFEGPFRNAGRWAEAMRREVRERGHELRALYFFYATCPKCARRFGRNRVVLVARVE